MFERLDLIERGNFLSLGLYIENLPANTKYTSGLIKQRPQKDRF